VTKVYRKKIITTVYLTEEILKGLKELSKRTGAPMAFLIRKALEEMLNKNLY